MGRGGANKSRKGRTALARLAAATFALKSPDQLEKFLAELLTPTELHDIQLRWELMERLHDGMPQRRIASELGISLCKITRGARILKSGNSVAALALEAATGGGGK